MANKGWVKLYRTLQDCWIWQGERFTRGQAWVDLLLFANHADKKIMFDGNLITVKRGQYLTSIKHLADRWGWDKDVCAKFLKLLERDGMLIKDSNKRRTLITIVNYEIYQDDIVTQSDSVSESVSESMPPLHSHSIGTNKNEKNDKNVKNEKNNKRVPRVYFPNDNVLDKAFSDYVQNRKALKTPMTDRAIDLAIQKVMTLSNGDNDVAVKILEQSIENGWKGLFELKEEKQPKPKGGRFHNYSQRNYSSEQIADMERKLLEGAMK